MAFGMIITNGKIFVSYDYDKYSKNRGMYFDIRDEIEGGSLSEDELIEMILKLNKKLNIEKIEKFRNKYVQCYGNATELSVDKIYENIK